MKLNKKGFTMVELLVVLLIIGVLAAVATPLYLANTNRAKASEAVATMGLIRQAEREYYTRHAVYLTVTAGNLANDPEAASNKGLGINVGIPQYFSSPAYTATTGGAFTKAGVAAAVDFVIYVNGSAATNPEGATAGKAVHASQVNNFKLEMDNTGTTYVTYDNGANWNEY